MQRGFAPIIILVGILVLASVGGAYYFKIKTPTQKACTMDAKICPDGSSVGRSGPNCEFSPCPTLKPTTTPDVSRALNSSAASSTPTGAGETANWKTYTDSLNRYSFKYPSNWILDNDQGESFINVYDSREIKNIKNSNSLGFEYEMLCPYHDKCEGLSDPDKIKEWTGYHLGSTAEFENGGKIIKNEEAAVSGIKSTRLFVSDMQEQKPTIQQIWIFVPHHNHMAHINWYGNDIEKLDQILSTFKFTN